MTQARSLIVPSPTLVCTLPAQACGESAIERRLPRCEDEGNGLGHVAAHCNKAGLIRYSDAACSASRQPIHADGVLAEHVKQRVPQDHHAVFPKRFQSQYDQQLPNSRGVVLRFRIHQFTRTADGHSHEHQHLGMQWRLLQSGSASGPHLPGTRSAALTPCRSSHATRAVYLKPHGILSAPGVH